MHPDTAGWDLSNQLLAFIGDALNVANWQRAGDHRTPAPKPIPRPGVKPDGQQIGKGAIPMDEMAKALGWELTGGAA